MKIFKPENFVNEIVWHYRRWTGKSNNFQQLHDTIIYYSKSKDRKFNVLYEDYTEGSKKRKLGGKLIRYSKGQKPYFVSDKSLNEQGVRMGNVFTDIPFIPPSSKERIGYKTQKPEALLKRIIECSTNEGDTVLDFFGGGGTTAKVCHDIKRRFIIGEVSPVAVRVIIERLKKAGCKDFETKQIPKTKEEWHLTDPHKFADTICEFKGWESNPKKSGDGGIDGWANNKKVAIQIKNHQKSIGRDQIQKFVGALNGYDEGFFVAWNFSPKAWDYRHIAERDFKKKITFFPAHQILGELVLTFEQRMRYQKLYEKAIKESKYAPPPLELVS